MDSRVAPSVKSKPNISINITAALASAVLEWLLILLLFIDAGFAYLVTKFAQCCQLQIPCLLCSRLDHVLGKAKTGFYWDLICRNHKLKISSFVLCHLHENLVDVHGMCESCLFSFATVNKSNAETYRLLVGKLGAEPHHCDEDPLLGDDGHGASSPRNCFCCNEPWGSSSYTQNLLQTKCIGFRGDDFDGHLSVTNGQDVDEMNAIGNEPSQSIRTCYSEKSKIDPLPHVEYKKVNISSDTESETAFSDKDSTSSLIRERADPTKNSYALDVQPEQPVLILADDLTSEQLCNPAYAHEPSFLGSELKLDSNNSQCTKSILLTDHGLEEPNWQQAEEKNRESEPSQLITFDDSLPPSDGIETAGDVSKETLDATGAAETVKEVVKENGEIFKDDIDFALKIERPVDLKPDTNDSSSHTPTSLDLGDAYKLAIKGRQLSGKFLEQISLKDSTRVSEDLKLLLSQLSAARGSESSINDMSPRVAGNSDEGRASDASTSLGMHILQKRISLERNESGLSLDGSAVSEIEGESLVDRLKRQVEHDKKLLGTMFKELEEERNASAVAANQAMAMITRLQEEKAALQMEALHCLRMMEEQAEYDDEALQKTNELLAEKEKVIQDLEYELEFYKKSGNILLSENLVDTTCEPNELERSTEQSDAIPHVRHTSTICNRDCEKAHICNRLDETAQAFEDDRLHILRRLESLEKRLQLFSNNGTYPNMDNSGGLAEKEVEENDLKYLHRKGISQENGQIEENNLQSDVTIDRRSHGDEVGCSSPSKNPQYPSIESSALKSGLVTRCTELDSLRNEFSVLSGRLDALEAEHRFLEQAINSVRNGDEGLKFIQEIACHLRELHPIRIGRVN